MVEPLKKGSENKSITTEKTPTIKNQINVSGNIEVLNESIGCVKNIPGNISADNFSKLMNKMSAQVKAGIHSEITIESNANVREINSEIMNFDFSNFNEDNNSENDEERRSQFGFK